MHSKRIYSAGKLPAEAERVLLMLHGRGAGARDILSFSEYLDVKDFALIAPQAENNSWYPHSFLAPQEQNEPWLTSALKLVKEVIQDLNEQGIKSESVYMLGFSQGACLTLEFAARNAKRYGGIIAFTGGLIGERIQGENYSGDFNGTPVFIGSSDPDPHVPVERVNATAELFRRMNASVELKIYKNLGHTISQDEISKANALILSGHKEQS
ncbi:MAG: phospholipase [Ignavibacteria bacterium]|jgi:phospholipase/carboxylesterase|nr:phospholipase [Ignavibacteria bacterium]MCU7501507.1 phospholipase [Ignavibacteria bacterium]MCU7515977.1 phospholipase [Ignavibacteria bacterium]